jgi:hypothetical protein
MNFMQQVEAASFQSSNNISIDVNSALLEALKTLANMVANSHVGYLPADDYEIDVAVNSALAAIHQVEPSFVISPWEDPYDYESENGSYYQ